MTSFFAGEERRGKRLSIPEYFMSGMATGFAVAFIEGPIDMVSDKSRDT